MFPTLRRNRHPGSIAALLMVPVAWLHLLVSQRCGVTAQTPAGKCLDQQSEPSSPFSALRCPVLLLDRPVVGSAYGARKPIMMAIARAGVVARKNNDPSASLPTGSRSVGIAESQSVVYAISNRGAHGGMPGFAIDGDADGAPVTFDATTVTNLALVATPSPGIRRTPTATTTTK